MRPDKRTLARRAGIELLAWAGVSIPFLFAYVHYFDFPATVVLPHLFLLAALCSGGVALRALLGELAPESRLTPWFSTALAFLPWAAITGWAAISLIGLYAWGRVTTWPMIHIYAEQAPALLQALGIPGLVLWMPLLAVIAILWALVSTRWFRPDWTRILFIAHGRGRGYALSLCMLVFPLLLGAMILRFGVLHLEEPLSLTFSPRLAEVKEHNAYSASPATNAAEAHALGSYRPAAPGKRRNYILIVGDALRADHMQVYGYPRATTPYLTQLANNGRLEVAHGVRSTCSESMCGYLALATSRYVHSLPTHPFTMQEVLRRNGYAIRLILSGDHTNFFGLRSIYGELDSYEDGSTQKVRPGLKGADVIRYMNDDRFVVDQVRRLPPSDPAHPTMLQIVLMSSHGLGLRRDDSEIFTPDTNYYAWLQKKIDRISPEDRQAAVNFYDNGVRQLDGYVKEILGELAAKGYLDDAVLVVTGDHGENLGEKGYYAHAATVYEPVLTVPFVLARFGYTGQPFVPRPIASQVDIAPTVLHELGLPAPTTWQGQALQQPGVGRLVYFQQIKEAGLYDVRLPGQSFKYWHDFGSGKEYVYDIGRDPKELHDLSRQTPPTRLAEWRWHVAHGGLQAGNNAVSNTNRRLP